MSSLLRRVPVVLALLTLLSSCPLPYDFSGVGAGDKVSSDPSSPHITTPVTIAYSEEGGGSGTLENDHVHVSATTTTVTLSTDTENAVIYYVDDGSDLTSFATAKKMDGSSGSITIVRTAGVEVRDIRAVAVGSGMLPSPVMHATISVSAFPILTLSTIDSQVTESGHETAFVLHSSEILDADLTVNLSTGGTYEAGEDVFALGEVPGGPGSTLTAVIAEGSESTILDWSTGSDADEFDDETVILILEPGDGYAIGSPDSATCIIQDNMTPSISISQATSSITDNGGTNLVTITSNLTLATQDLVVTLRATGDYEASDVSSIPGPGTEFTMTIPGGSNFADREIQASPDLGEFDDETVTLTIVDGAEYNPSSESSISFAIVDTSVVPELTLTVNRMMMSDAQTATFTVDADVAPEADTVVNLLPQAIETFWRGTSYNSIILPAGASSTEFVLDPPRADDLAGISGWSANYTIKSGTGYTLGSPVSRTVVVMDSEVPVDGLVSYYPLNGTLITGLPGRANGDGVYLVDTNRHGESGRAMLFNGVDCEVSIPGPAGTLSASDGVVSVSVWIKKPVAEPLEKFIRPETAPAWSVGTNGESVGFSVSTPSTNTASGTLAVGTWSHIIGTWDGITIHIYVNNALAGSRIHDTPVPRQAVGPLILGYFLGDYWAGSIDDLRVYNRILTPAERTELYNE